MRGYTCSLPSGSRSSYLATEQTLRPQAERRSRGSASGSLELDRSRGGRAPDNGAKARHRPTTDRAQMQSHAPGDRPAPPLQGRTNKTAALDPAPTDPSWPVPAADRVNVRESLFAEAFNRLLQQNRHKTDMPRQPDDVYAPIVSADSLSGAAGGSRDLVTFDYHDRAALCTGANLILVLQACRPRIAWIAGQAKSKCSMFATRRTARPGSASRRKAKRRMSRA